MHLGTHVARSAAETQALADQADALDLSRPDVEFSTQGTVLLALWLTLVGCWALAVLATRNAQAGARMVVGSSDTTVRSTLGSGSEVAQLVSVHQESGGVRVVRAQGEHLGDLTHRLESFCRG